MDERSKELTPPSECAVSPPPEFTLPPELLPPGTALPGEETSVSDAAALQAKAAKWKKLAYILVGGSALAASLLLGSTDTAAPDTVPDTGGAPAAYEEYAASGTLHYTVYNDTFDVGGEPLILAQGTVNVSALADTPLPLPQPETPAYGSYQFLGWVARYDTSAGKLWTRADDPLTAAFFAQAADGQTDWQTPLPVTLTAGWEKE